MAGPSGTSDDASSSDSATKPRCPRAGSRGASASIGPWTEAALHALPWHPWEDPVHPLGQ